MEWVLLACCLAAYLGTLEQYPRLFISLAFVILDSRDMDLELIHSSLAARLAPTKPTKMGWDGIEMIQDGTRDLLGHPPPFPKTPHGGWSLV